MSAPASAIRSGLRTARGQQPIPLEHVEVSASVVDLACTVTIQQRFRNLERVPLEVVYVFPLDEGAAVCGFKATVNGTRYVGAVKEREDAFRDYDEAMEAGHGAFLLDEERADVFTVSLGNLEPGSAANLTISYVTELASEGHAARFTLPTTVSPRYAPAADQVGIGRTDAEALNAPVADEVPYRFTFDMQVSMASALVRLESPSHPITVQMDGRAAHVRLTQRDAAMDRDLVVVIEPSAMAGPHATVERNELGTAVLVSFLPTFPSATEPAEVVFLVDRSGSMAGTSILEVRNALQLCLRSMSAGCRFNIVGFGSSFSPLFARSRAYDDASLAEASAHVAALEADMGGTEILGALESVLADRSETSLPLRIVLLTDGEVTNTDAVIALARRHAGRATIFSFGIGAGASQHLVKAVARATGGASEFIAPGERIEGKVLRQFRRVLAPSLSDIQLTWPDAGLVQAPSEVPGVFGDEPLRVYALGTTVPSGHVVLSGRRGAEPFRFEVPLGGGDATSGQTISRLAARARIRDLEEQPEFVESRGSRQRRARPTGAAAQIVELGVKYQLVSRETSFVAIEHRDTPVTGRAELRKVPVMLTRGWGGTRTVLPTVAMLAMPSPPLGADLRDAAPAFLASRAQSRTTFSALTDGIAEMMPARRSSDGGARHAAETLPPLTSSPMRPLDQVVSFQRADGTWALTPELLQAVGVEKTKVRAALAALRIDGPEPDAAIALATALAVEWLERHAARFRDEWALIADKARAQLGACPAQPRGTEWRDVARQLL